MRNLINVYLFITAQVMYSVGAGFTIICAIQGNFAETEALQNMWFTAGFGFLGILLLSIYVASKIKIEEKTK